MARILVVDDKEMMRDSLGAILESLGHAVAACDSAAEALNCLEQRPYDLIVSDLKMPQMDGLAFLDELTRRHAEAPVIMMTAYATVATAVQAMRKGAFDYIQKPFDADAIAVLVDRALEHRQLMRENEAWRAGEQDGGQRKELIGSGPAMRLVAEKIRLVAGSNATVLIRGESGTGKELAARAIHAASDRAARPMLCVNCAALSSSLLESELFGHEKGAFTGAERMRKGRFELAEGGTLLLDEISEMNLSLQSKLLRVLQEREFERVGSSMTRQVDVRVVATTNRDLEQWVTEGKFREDLFYRLNVVPVELPPLRRRGPGDIRSLLEYFLKRCAQRAGRAPRTLTAAAMALLEGYHWPGNVRELENFVERLSILAMNDCVDRDEARTMLAIGPDQPCPDDEMEIQDAVRLEDIERRHIQRTLEQFDGHRQKTAQALGIGVRTLGMKIKRWKDEGQLVIA